MLRIVLIARLLDNLGRNRSGERFIGRRALTARVALVDGVLGLVEIALIVMARRELALIVARGTPAIASASALLAAPAPVIAPAMIPALLAGLAGVQLRGVRR